MVFSVFIPPGQRVAQRKEVIGMARRGLAAEGVSATGIAAWYPGTANAELRGKWRKWRVLRGDR